LAFPSFRITRRERHSGASVRATLGAVDTPGTLSSLPPSIEKEFRKELGEKKKKEREAKNSK
jgi:hypothetical protein